MLTKKTLRKPSFPLQITIALVLVCAVSAQAGQKIEFIGPEGNSMYLDYRSQFTVLPSALGDVNMAIEAINDAMTSLAELEKSVDELVEVINEPSGKWAKEGQKKKTKDKSKKSEDKLIKTTEEISEGRLEDAWEEANKALDEINDLREVISKAVGKGEMGTEVQELLEQQVDTIEATIQSVKHQLGEYISAEVQETLIPFEETVVLDTLNQALSELEEQLGYIDGLSTLENDPSGEWVNSKGKKDALKKCQELVDKVLEALEKHAEGDIKDVPSKVKDTLKKTADLEKKINELVDKGKMGSIAQAKLQESIDALYPPFELLAYLYHSDGSLYYRTLLYVFGPHGTEFKVNAQLIVPWDEVLCTNGLFWYSGDCGGNVDPTEMSYFIDEENEMVVFLISHFSQYYFHRPAPGFSDSSVSGRLSDLRRDLLERINPEQDIPTQKVGPVTRVAVPGETRLLANYPNPFNPETWIPFELSEHAKVRIQIYDVSGCLVRTLNLGLRSTGHYVAHSAAAHWDGCNFAGEQVASGVYLYRLTAGDFSAVRRMVVIK